MVWQCNPAVLRSLSHTVVEWIIDDFGVALLQTLLYDSVVLQVRQRAGSIYDSSSYFHSPQCIQEQRQLCFGQGFAELPVHFVVNEMPLARAGRVNEDFVELLKCCVRRIELEDFVAVCREVGFQIRGEALVARAIELVGMYTRVLGKRNGLPSRGSTHVEDELTWLWIKGMGCKKRGRIEIVM